jgi:hypothetical protein
MLPQTAKVRAEKIGRYDGCEKLDTVIKAVLSP